MLHEKDIHWIEQLILDHGITDQALVESLLDHLCCMVENELTTSGDWQLFVENEIKKMHPIALHHLQTEKEIFIQQLKNNNMNKIVSNTLMGSVALLLTGVIFKIFHWPGASFIIVLGCGIGTVTSLISALHHNKEMQSVKFILITLLAANFSMGCLFKIQHWPFANLLMLVGVLGTAFLFVPISLYQLKSSNQLNAQNGLMHFLLFLTGTMTFMLFDLSLI